MMAADATEVFEAPPPEILFFGYNGEVESLDKTQQAVDGWK